MNCENCKNKKATVFYADDTGRQHSLCPDCAAPLGKIANYKPTIDQSTPFIPSPTLSSLAAKDTPKHFFSQGTDSKEILCPYCATSLQKAVESGKVGCPECYAAFSDYLFPATLPYEQALGARMPSSYRSALDRTRSITDLKNRIKTAIECENYELAAELRDKIRKLESTPRT